MSLQDNDYTYIMFQNYWLFVIYFLIIYDKHPTALIVYKQYNNQPFGLSQSLTLIKRKEISDVSFGFGYGIKLSVKWHHKGFIPNYNWMCSLLILLICTWNVVWRLSHVAVPSPRLVRYESALLSVVSSLGLSSSRVVILWPTVKVLVS